MLEQLVLPDLRQAVLEKDWDSLREFCAILHPPIIAGVIEELPDFDAVWTAFGQVQAPARIAVFEYFSETTQDQIVTRLPKAELAVLIERMAHDDRVDLVKRMDEEQQRVVMPLVARAEREDILRLKSYAEGTAGSIMTTDYAALPAELTVDNALQRLRHIAPDRETIYYVYVTDSARRLVGFISLKDLIRAGPRQTLDEIIRRDVILVADDSNVEDVASHLAQYDLLAIPVVDTEKKLVGIITHDDVIDVVIEQATEDAHMMGAVQPLDDNYLTAPFVTVWRKRAAWLSVLFVAELLTFTVLAVFHHTIEAVLALAFFLPLCIATGGNSGSQAATLITRAIALGQVGVREWWRILRHELGMGLALGLTLGFIGFLRALVIPESIRRDTDPVALAMVVGQAVAVICLWGTVIGSMLPILFKRFGVDPAYASSPFVATFVDVTGILIYLVIAKMYLLH